MEIDLIPLTGYAALIGREPVSVRQKCARGNVPGAVKLGRNWFVPKNAPYPDERVKTGKFRNWRNKPDAGGAERKDSAE